MRLPKVLAVLAPIANAMTMPKHPPADRDEQARLLAWFVVAGGLTSLLILLAPLPPPADERPLPAGTLRDVSASVLAEGAVGRPGADVLAGASLPHRGTGR